MDWTHGFHDAWWLIFRARVDIVYLLPHLCIWSFGNLVLTH